MFLGSEHKVGTSKTGAATISVNSDRLVADLALHGVIPNKTHVATAASLQHDRHFWRGVIDGDGWLGTTLGRYPAIHAHGSWPLMEQFATFVRSVTSSTVEARPHKSIARVALSGASAAAVIAILYDGANIALTRKLAKSQLILGTQLGVRPALPQ